MKDRIAKIIDAKGLTATKFAEKIDANPSAISHILSGRNKPGYDLLMSIVAAFPDVNIEWLMTGNGSMYKTSQNQNNELLLFENPPKMAQKETATTYQQEAPAIAAAISPSKRVKRIILFYEDGTFEEFAPS